MLSFLVKHSFPGDLIISVVASPTSLEETDSTHDHEDIPGDGDTDSVDLDDVDSDGDDTGVGEEKASQKAEEGEAQVVEGDEGEEGKEGEGEGEGEDVVYDTHPQFQEAWTDSQPPDSQPLDSQPPASPQPLLNTPARVPGDQCCNKRLPADGVSCVYSDLPVEDWCRPCRDQFGDDFDPEEVPLSQNKEIVLIEETPVKEPKEDDDDELERKMASVKRKLREAQDSLNQNRKAETSRKLILFYVCLSFCWGFC